MKLGAVIVPFDPLEQVVRWAREVEELGLGVGAGEEGVKEAAGLPPWTPRERSDRLRAFVEELDPLLRGDERRGFPVQRPRPPLTIAAWSPRNIRLAAERADRWNTQGGYGLSAEEGLRAAAAQVAVLEAASRRPVVRSFLHGYRWVAETPFASVEAFEGFVERYRDVGFDELLFYYPPERFSPPGTVGDGVLERVATELLPELRHQ